ncbi:hypothetical protein mRhiFer1_008755 [Rhinolophus ferrumequinum]|uniref:Uncharacterized protein n=1 Tax=Rhinolophus ferrumequinum TaxID=59479 RepID=A0A7J7TN80_RHIFE|nr:hypothetical protein mRhiFer1_008755 [Rhinolophus ferrumequinum]
MSPRPPESLSLRWSPSLLWRAQFIGPCGTRTSDLAVLSTALPPLNQLAARDYNKKCRQYQEIVLGQLDGSAGWSTMLLSPKAAGLVPTWASGLSTTRLPVQFLKSCKGWWALPPATKIEHGTLS